MKRRVVCGGTFDHFHPGHIAFLREAKALGDELIVIVARDETVERIKGFLPTHDERLRKSNVEDTRIPDLVVLGNPQSDLFRILEDLKPDVVAIGYDQRVSVDELVRRFPDCRVLRLSPFEPEKYKSSFFRNNENRV